MNKNNLFSALGALDDEILLQSEAPQKNNRYSIRTRIIAISACLCFILFSGIFVVFLTKVPVIDTDSRTSDKYDTVGDLLQDLSEGEEHSSALGQFKTSAMLNEVTQATYTAYYNGCLYSCTASTIQGKTYCTEIDSDANLVNEFVLLEKSGKLFLHGNTLAVIYRSGEGLSPSYTIRLYDLTIPNSPNLVKEYLQIGALSACYMYNGKLYTVTDDGVCACGFSRTDDISEYYPTLYDNGEKLEWGDDEIDIIGTPKSIRYFAMSVIDLEKREVCSKRAFYISINTNDIYYGTDFMAISSGYQDGNYLYAELYTYNVSDNISYTGKINLGKAFDMPFYSRENGKTTTSAALGVVDIYKADGVFRIIGLYQVKTKESEALLPHQEEGFYFIVTADENSRKGEILTLEEPAYNDGFYIQNIINENDRAILTINNENENVNKLTFVEFSGTDITVANSGFDVPYIPSYYEFYKNIFHIGNGIYVRMGDISSDEAARGFDIYDFSDSANPSLVFKASGLIEKPAEFVYDWRVIGENTFAILYTDNDQHNGTVPHSTSWHIYRYDGDSDFPLTKINELSYIESSLFVFEIFEFHVYEDGYYATAVYSRNSFLHTSSDYEIIFK